MSAQIGHLTNAEAEAWVRENIGEFPEPGIWWAFRQYAPFVHAPTGGPWSFAGAEKVTNAWNASSSPKRSR